MTITKDAIMRTISTALIWELLTRNRWQLVLMTCAANALPLLLFTALQYHGAIDYADSAFIVMHVALVQINIFVFGAGLMTSMGPVSRLFTYPVRNSTLVASQLIPAMVLMAIEMLLSTLLLNFLFDLHWPLWMPALFSAVALQAIIAAMWLTEKSAWLPCCVGVVGGALGLWFKSRHGPLFDFPTDYWETMSMVDLLVLLAVAGGSQAVAEYAVARNRRGETWPALGILAWIERTLDFQETELHRFRSPYAAQQWFNWWTKGWAMPVCMLFAGTLMGGLWLIVNRDLKELFEALYIGGGVATGVIGMIGGLVLGNSGTGDSSFAMGQFLATRPMTNSQFARGLLGTAARSTLIAWLLWAVAVALLSAVLLPTDIVPLSNLGPFVQKSSWWYVPSMIIVPWIVCTNIGMVGSTGRSQPFVGIVIVGFTVALFTTFVADYTLTQQQKIAFWRGVFLVLSIMTALGTGGLFLRAQRQALIDTPMVWASLATWCVLVAGLLAVQLVDPQLPPTVCISLGCVLSLAVAPIAGTPLAIAWNRTR